MKYLLKKTKYIIILICMICVCTNFFVGQIAKRYKQLEGVPYEFSNQYIKYSIGYYRDKSLEDKTVKDMVSHVKKSGIDFNLMKTNNKNITGVYSTKGNLPINIIEGRNFSAEDFKENNYVMLLSKSEVSNCIVKNNKKYYSVGSTPYEVIGIYDIDTRYSKGFYNILAEEVPHEKGSISENLIGDYFLETDKIDNIDNLLNEFCTISVDKLSDSNMSDLDYLFDAIKNSSSITIILEVIALIQFLNFMIFGTNWINSRKREINVRMLNGATYPKIRRLFQIQLFFITYITYFISFGIYSIISGIVEKNFNNTGVILIIGVGYITLCLLLMEIEIGIKFMFMRRKGLRK